MEEPLSGWFDCLDDQRHCCCAFWVLVSFVGPHNILRLIQIVVIQIKSPPPPVYPQTQFLSFSKFITSYTYSLLLLRKSLKSSHPVLVDEYSIILLILPFQNLIIIRCIVLELEHISAPLFFFYPFLADSYQYLFTSQLCLHESGMILFSLNIYCVDQQNDSYIALFCRFLSF